MTSRTDTTPPCLLLPPPAAATATSTPQRLESGKRDSGRERPPSPLHLATTPSTSSSPTPPPPLPPPCPPLRLHLHHPSPHQYHPPRPPPTAAAPDGPLPPPPPPPPAKTSQPRPESAGNRPRNGRQRVAAASRRCRVQGHPRAVNPTAPVVDPSAAGRRQVRRSGRRSGRPRLCCPAVACGRRQPARRRGCVGAQAQGCGSSRAPSRDGNSASNIGRGCSRRRTSRTEWRRTREWA